MSKYSLRPSALAVSALALLTFGAGDASAQEQELRGITMPLGVYDTNGSWVGTFAGSNGYSGYALHPYGGLWYLIAYSSKGIGYNGLFFYTNKSCSGQPYVYISDESPKLLTFDGATTLWAPSTIHNEQIVTAQSYSWAGNCTVYQTPQQGIYGAAIAVDRNANRWMPPFTAE
jgi:hypothetical protein